MERMLHLTRRLTFRNKAKAIGGGTGRVLVSYELKKVEYFIMTSAYSLVLVFRVVVAAALNKTWNDAWIKSYLEATNDRRV